jgi:hypothetical protein
LDGQQRRFDMERYDFNFCVWMILLWTITAIFAQVTLD